MVGGVLGIYYWRIGFVYPLGGCIIGWHWRQMREQSPGEIVIDDLVLHFNLDLSDKIKIFHLLSWLCSST